MLICVVQILVEDIMGEVALQKEVDAIRKSMKETKSTKSFESMELLSRVLTFPNRIDSVMSGRYQKH
jgi:U3 small nucleolar RNA-associated protein 20